jgi:two-component system sensor histidine kinase DesK
VVTQPAAFEAHPSQRLAQVILLTVLSGFVAVEAISVLPGARAPLIAINIVSICALFVVQVFNSSQSATHWPMPRRIGMLLAQALITYLPLLVLGREWGGMAGWLAGSILLLIPGWPAWVLFSAVIVSVFTGSVILNLGPYSVAYLTVASLDTGLVVFGLARLALIISYLKATRTELARFAIVRERMRFARDLHDLLGYSLSAITLKAELARRLADSDPVRTRDELARGYRNMSLAKEAGAAVSLLSAAGIRTEVGVDCGALAEEVDTALATVLREAVTNMLRHSSAQNCTIHADMTSGAVTLRVTNDGVPSAEASGRRGRGLENLASRLEAVGGKLSTSRHDDRFDVLATVGVPDTANPGLPTASVRRWRSRGP